MNKSAAGRRAEEIAVEHLRRNGYRILARNVKARFGEIDLVAQDGRTLCFVEVRSRSDARFGQPEESVTLQKQRRLIRLAQWYLQRRRLGAAPVRFDVLSIVTGPDGVPARTRLIQGAFDAA